MRHSVSIHSAHLPNELNAEKLIKQVEIMMPTGIFATGS